MRDLVYRAILLNLCILTLVFLMEPGPPAHPLPAPQARLHPGPLALQPPVPRPHASLSARTPALGEADSALGAPPEAPSSLQGAPSPEAPLFTH